MTAGLAAPPRSRRWRRLGVGLALLVLAAGLYVGWSVHRHFAHERLLQEALAETDAIDPHWRLEAIEARRTVVPEDENAAIAIRRVRVRLVRPNTADWQQRESLLRELSPAVRLTDAAYRDLIDAVEAVESAIGPALALVRYPRGRFVLTYDPNPLMTTLGYTDELHCVHFRVLEPLLLVLAHEGDLAGAVQVCRAMLNLGRSIGDEPFFMSQWLRGFHFVNTIRKLERVLGQGEVTEDVLAELQRALAEEAVYDPWLIGLRGERASVHQVMEGLKGGVIKPSEVRTMHRSMIMSSGRRLPPRTMADQAHDWFEDRFPSDVRPAQAWALRHGNRLTATARLSWPERRAAVEALLTERADAPELAILALSDLTEWMRLLQLIHARGRCAVAAVAAERYRLRHGAWPSSLAALTPDLLQDVPADPFDGRPLRYKRLVDGVVIYSVSLDTADNGGTLSDDHKLPNGTDLGFRLRDVPHRRQAPPEPAPAPPEQSP
jgi:hypothetical protein